MQTRTLVHSFLFPALLVIFSANLPAQGCSDGGVCSVGSLSILGFDYQEIPSDKTSLDKLDLEDGYVEITADGKPDTTKKTVLTVVKGEKDSSQVNTSPDKTKTVYALNNAYPKYQIVLGVHYGKAERGTTVLTTQVEGTIKLYRQKLFSQIKIPFSYITGNLGTISGAGDVTVSFSYHALDKRKKNLVFTLGGKIPANDGNLILNNLPLPMPYQTSLGSYDLLIGLKFGYKSWEFTTGYQHAFNSNGNLYLHLPNLITNGENYNNFFESNKMKRADDAILRVSKSFRFKKAVLNAGALGIYHLQEDTYVDRSGMRMNADGSSGLTLNLNATGVFKLRKNTDLTFIAAGPVINRKTRTDGLTRSLVLQLGLRKNLY